MIPQSSYLSIPAFARNVYGLKGNELLAFSLVHGFSQDGESCFHGSLKYVSEWLGCDKGTALRALKSLTEKGFIRKFERFENGVKFCSYRAVIPDASRKPSDVTGKPIDTAPATGVPEAQEKPAEAVSEPHEDLELRAPDPAESVLAYLNEKAGRRFKPIASTLSNIRARLKEGYTVADCEKVIDSKVGEWSGTEMAKYLTPQTLFRPSHFDTYLNTVDVDTTSRAPEQKGAPDAPMGDTWRPARSYDEARLKRVAGLVRTAKKAGNPELIRSIAKSEGLTEEEYERVMEAVR